jgi:hypothetical protein
MAEAHSLNEEQLESLADKICEEFYGGLGPYDYPRFAYTEVVIQSTGDRKIIFDFYEYSLPDEAWEDVAIAPDELLVTIWRNNSLSFQALTLKNGTISLDRNHASFDISEEIDFEGLNVNSSECDAKIRESYAAFVANYLLDFADENEIFKLSELENVISKQPLSIQAEIRELITKKFDFIGG